MNQKSRIPDLAPEIASYIAGLIDGEGTITLTRLHTNENRRLVVSIANTELQLLQFVIDQVCAGKITRKRTVSERHTPSFYYSITSEQALALLRKVTPFLRSYKRTRAELTLAQYKALTPRNGKYSPELLIERQQFEQSFLNLKAVQETAGSYAVHAGTSVFTPRPARPDGTTPDWFPQGSRPSQVRVP